MQQAHELARHPRILIVDDEQSIRKLLTFAFEREGYEVTQAASGDEALLLYGAEHFDVLLSDVRMPGINGHEVVQAISQRHVDTVCVLMSGYDSIECEGCGRCALLTKPFRPLEAVSLVNQLLH